jgi:D-psicose/D-tagatose/L-ribulose 3-epimerase
MKTGFNLLLWTTHVDEPHFALLERLKAVGYDGVEIPLFEGDVAHFERVGQAAEVHRQAADIAAAAGIALAIEPLNRFECYFLNTMADAKAHVRRVDRPNFGALYDTFHANIEEKDPIGCIAETGDVIRHVHVSENDRGTPGKGHVPWRATFEALRAAGYDGWLTIEAFGTAMPALAAATKIWRDLHASPEEVYEHGLKTIRENWIAAGGS